MEPLELLGASLDELCAEARRLRDLRAGGLVTYSPKVFIPLTKLCRDVCHYCTFAQPPRRGEPASATVHANAAREAGLEARVVDLPGLAFDVDTPDDLERMRS